MRRPHVLGSFLLPAQRESRIGGGRPRRNELHLAMPPLLLCVPLSIPELRLTAALRVMQAPDTADSVPLALGGMAAPPQSPTLRGSDESQMSAAALVSSSSRIHRISCAGETAEEAPLAPTLFHLLQLRRWGSSYPTSVAGACSSGLMTFSEQVSRDTPPPPAKPYFQQEGDLVRLRCEVHALGDLLRTYRFSYRPLPVSVPRTTPSISDPSQSSAPRRGSPKDRRAPVQLVATSTDAEEVWLLPLQQDVAQCVLRRLQVMELALKRLMARGTSQQGDILGGPAKAIREAVTAFFDEEVRVVAELVALRGVHERDAQSLACLVHVLTAAADVGVAVSATTLVEAAAAVVAHHGQRGEDGGAGSLATTPWCSCVPWLLHCYTTAYNRVSSSLLTTSTQTPGDSVASWSAASAWMTAAADRVCTTQSAELLQLTPTPAEGRRKDAAPGSGTDASVQREQAARAHTFGLWQGVLDAEVSCVAEALTYRRERDGRGVMRRAASKSWLRDWYAGYGVTYMGGGSNSDSTGTWHPYWQLVVSGMLQSCARAVDTIVELSKGTNVQRRSDELSSAGPKATRQNNPKPSSSTLATLEEMQFYAVGSYVSLRRIASSLQRHRRLVPLLQLHAMVSGCVGPSGAVADAFLSKQQQRRSYENDASPRSVSGVAGSLSMASAAAQWRRRLLSGELLQPRSTAPASQDKRRWHRRHDRPSPAYLPQRHQAGAMLWREVVLFDAYTLITIGHVSEYAIDGAELDKNAVLQQLTWLQQECALHLKVLGTSEGEVRERAGTDYEPAESSGNIDDDSAATKDCDASYAVSHTRRPVLLRCLTPRTRAGLIAKLQEGLRLSAKVLARWGTPEQICALYLRYPSMGASWEVGRALLQCGQYGVAMGVLESLLQTGAVARGAQSMYPTATSSTSPPLSLLSSRTTALRQLLLEAMEGAAAALVQHSRWSQAPPASGTSPHAAATPTDGSAGEGEVPLSAELRTQLHSLYTHLHSLPVPLPLCLHAVVRGLTSASSDTAAYGVHDDADAAPPLTVRWQVRSKSNTTLHSPSALPPSSLQLCTSAEERTRTTAVLCTYVLRCHLAENSQGGLLAKTVELWASCVAPYLGRRSSDGAEALPVSPTLLELSLSDRYLRAVTTRLLCGYPQLPVARLLLSRLAQLTTPPLLRAASDTIGGPSAINDNVPAAHDARVALTVVWLLGVLYRLVGMPETSHSTTSAGSRPPARVAMAPTLAYRLCVPVAVTMPPVNTTTTSAQDTEKAALMSCDTQFLSRCRVWSAGFTERYALDTLRLMPRIALEALERLLRPLAWHSAAAAASTPTASLSGTVQWAGILSGWSASFFHDRINVILQCRQAEEEEQRHPWQCSGCYLWNSRYTRTCKRCHALSTVLLQCRACGCLTSSADDRVDNGLSCDVCGAALVPPLSFQNSDEGLQSPLSPADPVLRASTINASQVDVLAQDLTAAAGRHLAVAAAAAATVTGTGRAASRFTTSASIARVITLRQWTCTHCRSPNDPHHVFFCRSCGRAATDSEKREAAASVTGAVSGASNAATALVCGCCGHRPKSIEARMLPWCEQCGALYQRIQELCKASVGSGALPLSTNSPSPSSAPVISTIPSAAATDRHSPHLWWCVECTSVLNPWTRTHCELCGAGRPATAAAVPGATRMTTASLSCGPSLLLEKSNAAAPFIVMPWLMQACPSCKAQSRVGVAHCWQCHGLLTWPLEVRQAVSNEWWRWVTQVAHVVVDVTATGSQTENDASCSPTGADAPLHVPRAAQWLCLHDGCMHLNLVNSAATDADGNSGASPTPLCHSCAACAFTLRRPVEVLSPFHDRFAWSEGAAQLSPTNAAVVVEALLLPPSAPLPGDITVRHSEAFGAVSAATQGSSTVRSAETATTFSHSHERWLHRSWSLGATATVACASCGSIGASGVAEAAEVSKLFPLRLRSLLMINVCASCGWCTWGRSSCAYDIPVTPRAGAGDGMRQQLSSSPPRRQRQEEDMLAPPSLLPGEHAMALRLLLKALAHAVQEGVALEVPPPRRAASTPTCTHSCGASTAASSSVGVTAPHRRLDWAWLSRFVFSGVRLITSSVSEALPSHGDAGGGSCAVHHLHCLHERLPWRGCDLASAQQACSAEPRVGVLESGAHDTGRVHSAIVDVRQVLDGVCTLAEHRIRGSLPSSRSPRRRHHGKGDPTHQQNESPPELPPSLQDAWIRRLLLAALELIDVVSSSTVFDEIGFATLRRLCLLLRPHEADHINTETKWTYLRDMKLSRTHMLHGCVQCERCLTTHGPEQPCVAP
ncbi:hypothetical protein, conserved [Leishmania lindenbergi]|uniref:RanBP2-type domain-containing protein n=1 Tax=Leishmania lindenbergi TaxID=651832 RepID=A0AAW3A9K3_9TRYP